MPNTWVTDLTHFVDANGFLAQGSGGGLAAHFARIVEAVSGAVERACPPEDCGGPPGHDALVRNRRGARGFDPEAFSPEDVRFGDARAGFEMSFGRRMPRR